MNPTKAVQVDPRLFFIYAEAFSEGCYLLKYQFQQAAHPMNYGIVAKIPELEIWNAARTTPFMTIDTFALELYFKCLHAMDHRGAPVRGHNYWELFKGLKLNTRRRIRANYIACAEKSGLLTTMPKRRKQGFMNFSNYLKRSARTFEDVRYLFERQYVKKKSPMYWSVMKDAVRKSILDIMPEWACQNEATFPLP